MKNRKWILALAAFAMAWGVSLNQANAHIINVGDTVRFFDSYGTTSGGEFIVQKQNPDSSWSHDLFATFCVERNESLGFNQPYYVYDVSSTAHMGGINYANAAGGTSLPGSPDPIDGRTAWLFKEFAKGTLLDYDYANTGNAQFSSRDQSANALQRAIWYIEQEMTDAEWNALSATSQYYYNLANAQSAAALNGALNAVKVINPRLPTNSTAFRQSTLMLVPEPGAIAIWSVMAGIGFAVAMRRKLNG